MLSSLGGGKQATRTLPHPRHLSQYKQFETVEMKRYFLLEDCL
jgi:hypothetical protein